MDNTEGAKRGTSSRPISISPPPKRHRLSAAQSTFGLRNAALEDGKSAEDLPNIMRETLESRVSHPFARTVASPAQLNFVEKLPSASNVDTISLGSILGDVMIRECWLFNYLFDLDFVMSQFDPDVRRLVKIRVVHGSWKREDTNKINIDEAAKRFSNIDIITAYMPEAFGTHHSKMIVLFRHDDLAQIVILTGNLIQRDWSMSQAIWRSPLLPLQSQSTPYSSAVSPAIPPLGSGLRFKHDLMAYLKTYGGKLKELTSQMDKHDFTKDPDTETLWGWPGLKHILGNIQTRQSRTKGGIILKDEAKAEMENSIVPRIVIQVSSVASLGDKWLSTTLLSALSTTNTTPHPNRNLGTAKPTQPRYSIVFPTADEIRRSVDGYGAGASIHMKTQTPAQAKQLAALRPMLCHWASDVPPANTSLAASNSVPTRQAHRKRAAPHIKTYVRFTDQSLNRIDWAMVTSANLSTQAWGSATSAAGEVRICSYEIGVVLWPALWNGEGKGEEANMVPVFGTDTPQIKKDVSEEKEADKENKSRVVGWRMPYDLPLVPYGNDEMPWCATQPCDEPDWMGRVWPGYGA